MRQKIGIFCLTLFLVVALVPVSISASSSDINGEDFCPTASNCETHSSTRYVCRNNDTWAIVTTITRCPDGSTRTEIDEYLYRPGICPYSTGN